MEDQKIVIAADDRRRASGKSKFQVHVVLCVTAVGDACGWLETYRFVPQEPQEVLPPRGRNGSRELWPAQYLGYLGVDRRG
jgi:hypothetical protein